MSIFTTYTLATIALLIFSFIVLALLTIGTWFYKESPFKRNQKNILTFWLLATAISCTLLYFTFSSHDRNIAIIIFTACICFWSIFILRDGNKNVLSESPQSIAFFLLILSFVIMTYGFEYIYHGHDNWLNQLVSDFYANSGTELVSIVITVIVLDRLNDRKNEKEYYDELVVQLRSPDSDTVIEAIQMLNAKDWLNRVFKDNSDIDLPENTSWSDGQNMRKFTHPQEWQANQIMKITNYENVLKIAKKHTFDLIQVAPEYRAGHLPVERYHPSLYPETRA